MNQISSNLRAAQPAIRPPDGPRAEFLALPFSLLPQREAVRRIIAGCGAPYGYVVTPNAYHVATVHDQPARLLPIYRAAWLSLCDSRILRTLAWLEGHSLPLVTGSDLVAALFHALSGCGPAPDRRRFLIVGPPPSAAAALRAAYPDLEFDVLATPAGLGSDAELRLQVARACIERSWDILLLCVGCPAQELIARQIGELGRRDGVALCVGAAVDFLTGARVRAPRWLQKLSLEWAYRLAREPRRLWHRYLIASPKVFRIFISRRFARAIQG
jgi:N-acetylglucosaminyldiphosphoundecaprenol N-acetyl-beta-D-mannosaminyltransferase